MPSDSRSRAERLHQRNTARQQRLKHARKLRDLVFDPDLAENRESAASRIDPHRCAARVRRDQKPKPDDGGDQPPTNSRM